MDKIAIAGATLSLVAALFFIAISVTSNPYPTSQLAAQSQRFLSTSNVGVEDSQFMWNNLSTALAGQAIVIFVAAAGCLAILRTEEKKEAE